MILDSFVDFYGSKHSIFLRRLNLNNYMINRLSISSIPFFLNPTSDSGKDKPVQCHSRKIGDKKISIQKNPTTKLTDYSKTLPQFQEGNLNTNNNTDFNNLFLPKQNLNIFSTIIPSTPGQVSEDEILDMKYMDQSISINPFKAHLIPNTIWEDTDIPFPTFVQRFFRKRNSLHCKFPYKLINALRISDTYPELSNLVGVQWVTNSVFLVKSKAFAKLLGIKSIDGSLFHKQGNFPSHGFYELSFDEASALTKSLGIDYNVASERLLCHLSGKFCRNASDDTISVLKWNKVS